MKRNLRGVQLRVAGNEFQILSPEKFHGLSLFFCSVVGRLVGNHPETSREHTGRSGQYSAHLHAPILQSNTLSSRTSSIIFVCNSAQGQEGCLMRLQD